MTLEQPDREQWRNYLATSKNKIIDYARSQAPKTEGKTLEEASLSAMRKQGAEDLIEKLIEAARVEKPRASQEEHVDVTIGIPK